MEHCPSPATTPPSHPTFCAPSPTRGSAIAKIVGGNAAKLAHFDPRVTMWVFEEDVGGRKLTEIINTQHENVKYLPGHKLPSNVVSPHPTRERGGLLASCGKGTFQMLPGLGKRLRKAAPGTRHSYAQPQTAFLGTFLEQENLNAPSPRFGL